VTQAVAVDAPPEGVFEPFSEEDVKRVVTTLPYTPRKWARAHLHGPKDKPNFRRNGVIVIHRRGGKTTGIVNHWVRYATDNDLEADRLRSYEAGFSEKDIKELLRGRHYAHILPELKQAKLVAWQMLKDVAMKVPGATKNETELAVSFPDPEGSDDEGARNTVRLFGSENPDALRGGKFSGASYDEYQDHNPYLHGTIVSKALADHLGIALWAGTIKGKNQLYQVYQAAKKAPEDYVALWQDINESLKHEEGATIIALRRALEDDRKQVALGLMLQTEFDQEWYLSPEAAIKGAIWGKEMAAVRDQKRIRPFAGLFEPSLPVDTDWDLGIADHMTVWLSQTSRTGEVRIVHAYSNQGEGIPHYVNYLNDLRTRYGFVYGKHWAPHDIEVRELTTGKSRRQTMKDLGFSFDVGKQVSLEDGINAVRLFLPRCYFAEDETEMGREALMQYRWKFNETTNEFLSEPVHDWASHFADAFRGLACRHKLAPEKAPSAPRAYGPSAARATWMGA
jgi:phage terminase large subunit